LTDDADEHVFFLWFIRAFPSICVISVLILCDQGKRFGGLTMYRKILVPLDGSQVAEGVLPHAKALAYSQGAELVLLTVGANPALDFAFSDPGIAQQAVEEQEERSKKYISGVEAQLKAAGFKVSTQLRVGSVADVILGVAEEMNIDVIAMSTHGRTGPARWIMGSVAERVVRNSKVPVLLIRATEKLGRKAKKGV
jgi:nucleotide-binding universal stress UspA family protein